MSTFREFLEQLIVLWRGSTGAGRTASIVGIVVLLSVVGFVGIWSSQPQYIALASELAPTDAAEIVSRLESGGIRHQLNFSGSAVLVDKTDWNRARLLIDDIPALSAETSFDSNAFGDSEMNRAKAHRRREEALAKTIKTMQGVANASVYLAIAEPSVFTRNQADTTASVVLELRSGMSFTREQSATITTFVANSVEGLSPTNVSVVDTRGRLLSSSGSSSHSKYTANLEHQRSLEAELAAKANTMLSQLLGVGRAMVRVSADLDFTSLERTSTRYDPEEKVRTQEEVQSYQKTGGQRTIGGASGIESHLQSSASRGSTTPIRETEETNSTFFENSKTVDIIRESPGSVKRLTIAVMVDLRTYRSSISANDEEGKSEVPSTRPALEKESVAAIVKQAVGFDETRGDQIEVLITEFASADETLPLPVSPPWELYASYLRNGSLGIAAVVALLLGLMTLRKMRPLTIRVPESDIDNDNPDILTDLTKRMQENPDAMKSIIASWFDESDESKRAA